MWCNKLFLESIHPNLNNDQLILSFLSIICLNNWCIKSIILLMYTSLTSDSNYLC